MGWVGTRQVNPVVPELTVDHSVVTDVFGRPMQWPSMSRTSTSATTSATLPQVARSSSGSCPWCRPGPIMHQINLEYLADVVVRGTAGVPRHPGGTDRTQR